MRLSLAAMALGVAMLSTVVRVRDGTAQASVTGGG